LFLFGGMHVLHSAEQGIRIEGNAVDAGFYEHAGKFRVIAWGLPA
jgi:hypothetical protein